MLLISILDWIILNWIAKFKEDKYEVDWQKGKWDENKHSKQITYEINNFFPSYLDSPLSSLLTTSSMRALLSLLLDEELYGAAFDLAEYAPGTDDS